MLLGAVQVIQCLLAGNRFDTTHASRHTAFTGDLEQADVTGAVDVGPAAQLDGETTAHGQHAHLIAVFLAEQRHGALALGRLDIGFLDFNGSVAANLGVDLVFQRLELLGLDRLEMAEVEA